MSIIETPVSPLWMDKRLLALWLRTQYGEVSVAECEVENASSTGDNYMSVMHRMVARTPGGDSHYLLIKSRMEEGTTASVMKESSIFRKEQELYAVTLPKLRALLHKAMPGTLLKYFYYVEKNIAGNNFITKQLHVSTPAVSVSSSDRFTQFTLLLHP